MRPYFFLLLCFRLFLFISAFPSFTFVFHSAGLSILFLISFYTANANEALFFFSRHDQRPLLPAPSHKLFRYRLPFFSTQFFQPIFIHHHNLGFSPLLLCTHFLFFTLSLPIFMYVLLYFLPLWFFTPSFSLYNLFGLIFPWLSYFSLSIYF